MVKVVQHLLLALVALALFPWAGSQELQRQSILHVVKATVMLILLGMLYNKKQHQPVEQHVVPLAHISHQYFDSCCQKGDNAVADFQMGTFFQVKQPLNIWKRMCPTIHK